MTDNQLQNIERVLGGLLNEVTALRREFERDRLEATQGRARVYERVEDVEKAAAQAKVLAETNAKIITDEIKPQTDKLKNLGLKGGGFLAGAAMVGGLASAPFFTTIAAAFEKVFR